jgi:hypothetical protein
VSWTAAGGFQVNATNIPTGPSKHRPESPRLHWSRRRNFLPSARDDDHQRLFWWGERAKMPNWRNLSFDGGWDPSGDGRPLGWQLGGSFSAGGSRESVDVVWGDAYRITADGVTVERGLIQQTALTDVNGNPLLQNNTDYSVRAQICRSAGLTQGTFRINCYSVSEGFSAAASP